MRTRVCVCVKQPSDWLCIRSAPVQEILASYGGGGGGGVTQCVEEKCLPSLFKSASCFTFILAAGGLW